MATPGVGAVYLNRNAARLDGEAKRAARERGRTTVSSKRVAVLGTGSWGTTFAQVLADAGHQVSMWGRRNAVVEMINAHENSSYLPGIDLSESIVATTDLDEALDEAEMAFVGVPVAATAEVVAKATASNSDAVYVSLAKGIETGSRRTITEIIRRAGDLDSSQVALISGPNLSMEIAMKQPTASVAASTDLETGKRLAKICHNAYFRPYVSTDVIGCEIAGSTKNVIAIAIGASEGMGLGANTRATLMTRGLAEMTRLGEAVGANPGTFAGLAGMGDLVATCSSRLSRNYSLGYRMGKGMSLEEALNLSPGVAEGAKTAGPLLEYATERQVDMPITTAVVAGLSGEATVQEMGEMLLGRPQKMDGWEIELLD